MADKVSVDFKEGVIVVGGDTNMDGQNSVEARIYPGEAIQEAFQRQDAVEGEGVAKWKFEGGKLMVEIDTDKDGEKVIDVSLDIMEALDEAKVL